MCVPLIDLLFWFNMICLSYDLVQYGSPFLKVMEAVLNHFPKEPTTYEQVSRSMVIRFLEQEYGLTELLLR